MTCRIVTSYLNVTNIIALLSAYGMTQAFTPAIDGRKNICVQLDGCVIGWARPPVAQQLATNLRIWKTEGKHDVPLDLEIGFVPKSKGGQYPGLFLFSSCARMMRPVKYLANGRDDQIGSFEQVYMNIACTPEEIEAGVSTHVEHRATNFLSILANLIPFSDFNQVRYLFPLSFLVLSTTCPESTEYLSVSGKLRYSTRSVSGANQSPDG